MCEVRPNEVIVRVIQSGEPDCLDQTTILRQYEIIHTGGIQLSSGQNLYLTASEEVVRRGQVLCLIEAPGQPFHFNVQSGDFDHYS